MKGNVTRVVFHSLRNYSITKLNSDTSYYKTKVSAYLMQGVNLLT